MPTYASMIAEGSSRPSSRDNFRKKRKTLSVEHFSSNYKSAAHFIARKRSQEQFNSGAKLIPQEYWDYLLDQAFKAITESSSDDFDPASLFEV